MAQALLRRRVLWAPQILTEVRRFGKASLANRIMEMQLKLCTERWVLEFRRRIFQYLLGEFLDSGHPGTTLETPTPARSSFRLLVSLDAAALVSYHLRSRVSATVENRKCLHLRNAHHHPTRLPLSLTRTSPFSHSSGATKAIFAAPTYQAKKSKTLR